MWTTCHFEEVSLDPNIDKIEENDNNAVMITKPTSAPASPCLKHRTLSGAATCRPIYLDVLNYREPPISKYHQSWRHFMIYCCCPITFSKLYSLIHTFCFTPIFFYLEFLSCTVGKNHTFCSLCIGEGLWFRSFARATQKFSIFYSSSFLSFFFFYSWMMDK